MTTDPMRALDALDALEPPDQWDDIVARAADEGPDLAEAPAQTAPDRRRLLAVAAIVVVVAALAAALVLRPGGGDDRADDPAAIWGHRWELVRIDVSGGAVTDQLRSTSRGRPVLLDASREGRLVTEVCNRFTVDSELDGDRLRFDDPGEPAIHCPDGLEDLVANLFTTSASVEVRGTRLVLQTPVAKTHLIMDPPPDPVRPPRATYTFVRSDAAPSDPAAASGAPRPAPASAFFGHRWAMVEALDDGVRLAQPRDYVVATGADPDTFEAPGCDRARGPATIGADRVLTVDVADPSPLADCYFAQQTNWDQWFRELLAAAPQVAVYGQRALITAPGKQVLLVRLD